MASERKPLLNNQAADQSIGIEVGNLLSTQSNADQGCCDHQKPTHPEPTATSTTSASSSSSNINASSTSPGSGSPLRSRPSRAAKATLVMSSNRVTSRSPSPLVPLIEGAAAIPKTYEETLQCTRQFMDTPVSMRHMPSWYHDNIYIHGGYRKIQFSYYGCLRSLFYLHNETGNVYSHLLGAVAIIGLTLSLYLTLIPIVETTTWADHVVICVFLASAFTCLGLSAAFHLFCCHSREVCKKWNVADYVGIVVLIVGSNIPSYHYAFYCHPFLHKMYTTFITVLGAATIITMVNPVFQTPKYLLARVGMFTGLGVMAVFPVSHVWIIKGFALADQQMAISNVLSMGGMYLLGAFLFATRMPERFFPGKLDIWAHSHQLFHCLVVTAALTHYAGVVSSYKYWHFEGIPNNVCALKQTL